MEELYYYPDWEVAKKEYKKLVNQCEKVWKSGSFFEELQVEIKFLLKSLLAQGIFNTLFSFIKLRSSQTVEGRWSSKIRVKETF